MALGGISGSRGILFIDPDNEKVSSGFLDEENNLTLTNNSVKLLRNRKFLSAPFLRGVGAMIDIFKIQYDSGAGIHGLSDMTKLEKFISLSIVVLLTTGITILSYYGGGILTDINSDQYLYNFSRLVIKTFLLIIYLYIAVKITKGSTFKYHGAEHKLINCYEEHSSVSFENAKKSSRFHARCGTNFLYVSILFGIVFYGALDTYMMTLFDHYGIFLRIVIHTLLIPVSAGISYEFIALWAKLGDRLKFMDFFLKFQKLTVFEPDDEHLELAIEAFKGLKKED